MIRRNHGYITVTTKVAVFRAGTEAPTGQHCPQATYMLCMLRALIWPLWTPGQAAFHQMVGCILTVVECSGNVKHAQLQLLIP